MDWLIRYGWYFLISTIAGEIIVPFILALFYTRYSHSTMVLSSLGSVQSPVRIIYNIWLLIAGLMFSASIPSLYTTYRGVSPGLAVLSAGCVAAFALGACICSGFFSVNEHKDVQTTASRIHGAASAVGFMLLLPVPLFLSILSYRSDNKLAGTVSLLSFVLAFACFVFFIMADKVRFQNTVIAREGLWQRLNLLFMYLPLGFAALTHM